MDIILTCPFCKGPARIVVCDDEGNFPKDADYEADPWSGLGYLICHDINDANGECPIARYPGEDEMGLIIYSSPEKAAENWNRYKED